MRIAVDARFFQAEDKPDLRDFTKEVFTRLSANHSEVDFIFFMEAELSTSLNSGKNVSVVTLTPKPTNFLKYKWWYDVKVARALKTLEADVFVATYGLASLTSSVKQVLIVRDLSFLQKNINFFDGTYGFYKRYTRGFLKKAKAIATLSGFIKEELSANYKIVKTAIHTIGSGVSAYYNPIDWKQREVIKEQFAKGCEYFVFSLGIRSRVNFLNVIKAFSIFKKWQKSNMKLVLIGAFDPAFDKELNVLTSYKFRDEVFINRNLSEKETAEVVAASYALIFPSVYEGFALPIAEALHCEVPVITSNNSSISEIAGNAALYVDASKPEDIAEQMKKIYKDEQLRNKLIEEGRMNAKQYNWNKTSELLWQGIQQAYSQ